MPSPPTFDFDAVSLDVGGVLVVPDHGFLARALDSVGATYDRSKFWQGHYLAMHEVDRCISHPEYFGDYLRGFLAAVEVPSDHIEAAHDAVDFVFDTPIWCQPVPGSRAAIRQLAGEGVPLGITSNSDGTLADLLARHEIAQVGTGQGVHVEWISDSGALGIAKPDRAIFEATRRGLGDPPPERVLHVGDGVHYDVEGALAAGLQAAHFDPFHVCGSRDHAHVSSLFELCGTTRATPA